MKWEYYSECSSQLKFKQNMYICVSIDLNKTGISRQTSQTSFKLLFKCLYTSFTNLKTRNIIW